MNNSGIVLKLLPKRKEKLEWYREVIDETKNLYANAVAKDIKPLWEIFNDMRVVHYGDFSFDREKVEIIELSDIYKNLSDEKAKALEAIKELKRIKR